MLSAKIKELRKKNKLTLENIAVQLGTSKQTVQRYEKGLITHIPYDKIERLAEILSVSPAELLGWSEGRASDAEDEGLAVKRVPMLGSIACGQPVYAAEEYDGFAALGPGIDADFCLVAHGDSMTGARIFDGDTVFIRAQSSVDNGDIAAVIINDEATLKRVYYYPEEEKLILSPENPKYAPFVYIKEELDTIKILGKAVAFQSVIA